MSNFSGKTEENEERNEAAVLMQSLTHCVCEIGGVRFNSRLNEVVLCSIYYVNYVFFTKDHGNEMFLCVTSTSMWKKVFFCMKHFFRSPVKWSVFTNHLKIFDVLYVTSMKLVFFSWTPMKCFFFFMSQAWMVCHILNIFTTKQTDLCQKFKNLLCNRM